MGTNVYYYKKLEEDLKQRIIEDLEVCDSLPKMFDYLQTFREEHPGLEEIHVGKRSCGWKFLFAREILKYCEPNKESILNWLSTGEIINEYYEKITPEEFWQKYVIDFQDGWNSDDYYKEHPLELRREKMDEMIGDLRFTDREVDFA